MYSDEKWYERILTAVLEAIAASRYDDSLASIQTVFLQEHSDLSDDIVSEMPQP